MNTYKISSKDSGAELYVGVAASAEAAVLAMEADIGAAPVTVIDDSIGVDGVAVTEERHFESAADALKVFVPEAVFHIEVR